MPTTQPTPFLQVFTKIDLGAQQPSGGFIALGDLVLYQPVNGRPMVYIAGVSDKAGKLKSYRHEAVVYNRKSHF